MVLKKKYTETLETCYSFVTIDFMHMYICMCRCGRVCICMCLSVRCIRTYMY